VPGAPEFIGFHGASPPAGPIFARRAGQNITYFQGGRQKNRLRGALSPEIAKKRPLFGHMPAANVALTAFNKNSEKSIELGLDLWYNS
jgi:hypothetical protein